MEQQRGQGGGRQCSGNTEDANKAAGSSWGMTGTGATCTPLHLRKHAPFLGPSLPATHLQSAAVAQVTPQALECAA